MLNKLRTCLTALALGLAGCTMPTWTPDTVPLMSQAGPVTSIYAPAVTERDWACKCHCVKGCYQ